MPSGPPAKKKRERRILDCVYARLSPVEVIPSERPDFLVRLRDGLPLFGVEVTEFYDKAARARLQRSPGYVGELLSHHRYRHKEDKAELALATANIRTPSGGLKAAGVQCVLTENPSLDSCAQKAARAIRSKDAKLDSTLGGVTHVNLVICDRTGLLGLVDSSMFYARFCTTELKEAIFGSMYREIYFVTRLSGKHSYVPLKLLTTAAELRVFIEVLLRQQTGAPPVVPVDLTRQFAAYLNTRVAGLVRLRTHDGGSEVLYGDGAFAVNDAYGIDVRMYEDDALPRGETIPKKELSRNDVALHGMMRTFMEQNVLSIDLSFPAGPLP